MTVSVVWFKRDLRISDNPALLAAINSGTDAVVCISVVEPSRLQRKDVDAIHIQWELDCLTELRTSLESIGGRLLFHHGEVVDYLTQLNSVHNITGLFCNEETGLEWSVQNNLQVCTHSLRGDVSEVFHSQLARGARWGNV